MTKDETPKNDNAPIQEPAGVEGLTPIPFPPMEPGREATAEEAAEVTDVPADSESAGETEGDLTDSRQAELDDQPIHIATKAKIEWLDAEGAVETTEECWRSLANVFITLATHEQEKTRKLDQAVRVTLTITDADGKPSVMTTSEGEERSEVVLFEDGTLEDALNHFAMQAMPPAVAYTKLQGAVAQISEMSNLKAAMITLIFDDGKPAGMVFMSDAAPVEDHDVVMLGTSSEAFVDQYKAAMRKQRNVSFPDDSPIIVPGGAMPPRGPAMDLNNRG